MTEDGKGSSTSLVSPLQREPLKAIIELTPNQVDSVHDALSEAVGTATGQADAWAGRKREAQYRRYAAEYEELRKLFDIDAPAVIALAASPVEEPPKKEEESRVDHSQYDPPTARPLATAAENNPEPQGIAMCGLMYTFEHGERVLCQCERGHAGLHWGQRLPWEWSQD